MSVALLCGPTRCVEEPAMLQRLAVGLMNEGVAITSIWPTGSQDTQRSSLVPRMSIDIPVSWLMRSRRRRLVTEELAALEVNQLVAFGGAAQQLATDVAPALGAAVLVEVASMAAAERCRRSAPVDVWLASSPSIHRRLAERIDAQRTAFVPMGVATGGERAPHGEAGPVSIAVLDGGGDVATMREVMQGLRSVIAPNDTRVFMELQGAGQHRCWRAVRDAGLLDHVSCIASAAAVRSLIAECDLVVLPTRQCGIRTVLLEAMLHGVPVLAPPIPGLDMLIDGETSMVVKDQWGEALGRILEDVALRQRLGEAASKLIASHYSSTAQVESFTRALS